MTYDPNGQYPPPNQDPNAGAYPTSGPSYPSSGAGYPTSGATPASGGAYPQQGGDPYQQGGYQQAGYQASSYPTSGGYQGGYDQSYQQAPGAMGVDPATGQPLSDKTKLVAGLLGIFLGGFGVGRFYTGHTGLGVAQLLVSVFTCGAGALWGFIDGILILVNGGTDAQGRKLRDS